MVSESNLILDKNQVMQKIRRIAFEIYEHNLDEDEIIIAGVYDKGYVFAQLLQNEFLSIAPIKSKLVKITLDKVAPVQSEVILDVDTAYLKNKCIILADDVLNTGRTLIYSFKPFLNVEVKKLQTAVIVDRGHKSFPVSADYTGFSLATSIKEHIEVNFDENTFGVYIH